MEKIAVIFAGGSGKRMGAGIPKQFLKINDKPIICHTLEKFQFNNQIDKIYIACIEEYIDYMKNMVNIYHLDKVKQVISGGTSGQESIYKILKVVQSENPETSIVLIHDGVRPFITDKVISDNIESVINNGSAITCTKCNETLIISEDGVNVNHIPLRKNSYTAQAPQSFILKEILLAHEKIRSIDPEYKDIVDSCTLVKKMGGRVTLIEGNKGNIKVTTPEDFYVLRALLQYQENQQIIGINSEFDNILIK